MTTYGYDEFNRLVSVANAANLDQTGILSNNILYAGYQYDFETGLYYLNARMYDPVTARFMQEDTYTGEYNDPLSLNLFTYCKNEPIRYSDPTGHNTLDDYDYQKKAEEKQTRSSNTLDNYAYQNQTRITKDRQSKSVDDYYYYKNISDAQLKAQTLEQQRPTITSVAKSSNDDMGVYIDPDSVGPTWEGIFKAGASSLVGVSAGVLQTAFRGLIFLPSLFEQEILKTDQLDRNSQRMCDDMDNFLLSNSQIIDKESYNIGKPGGAAIFLLASLPEMAQSVVNLGRTSPKIVQGFSSVGSSISGGATALIRSRTISISVDAGALVQSTGQASFWTGQAISSYNGLQEGSAGNSLPDDATVVRGGESKPKDLQNNQAAGDDGTLSARGGTGLSEAELSNGLPQNKISTTTAGELRAKGYDVVSSPTANNPNHVSITTPGGKVLTEVEAANLQSTFTIKPNPSKIK